MGVQSPSTLPTHSLISHARVLNGPPCTNKFGERIIVHEDNECCTHSEQAPFINQPKVS